MVNSYLSGGVFYGGDGDGSGAEGNPLDEVRLWSGLLGEDADEDDEDVCSDANVGDRRREMAEADMAAPVSFDKPECDDDVMIDGIIELLGRICKANKLSHEHMDTLASLIKTNADGISMMTATVGKMIECLNYAMTRIAALERRMNGGENGGETQKSEGQ